MNIKINSVIVTLALVFAFNIGNAQNSIQSYSLSQAQEYALNNNKALQIARLESDVAKYTTWENISMGLPNISASSAVNDYLDIATSLVPAEIFGGAPGTYMELQFGTQFSSSIGLSVSQLIFSGPYIIGLQTSRLYKKMTDETILKSEQDTKEGVISAYYMILLTKKSMDIIDSNISNMQGVLNQTEVMYAAGIAELTDVDQLKVQLDIVLDAKRSLERNFELSKNLFRIQLGLDLNQEITLTDNLNDIFSEASAQTLLNQSFSYQDNINYRLLGRQVEMSEKAMQLEQSNILPSLAGFYSWQSSGQGNELNDLVWYPVSVVGLQLDIPIFAGGQRYSRIQKARVELEKSKQNQALVADQLMLQETQLRYNLSSNLESYFSQLKSIDVSKRVYDNIALKYTHGIASSLELTQANTTYLESQNQLITSMMNVLNSKLALDKLMNNF